jgi:threonine/homoserine/homoserine lactone efflux protein
MQSLPLLAAFIATATVITITPGLDTAMVLRTAAVEGRRPAVLAGLGIALGCLVWGAAASAGLGVLLQASKTAYTALKIAGAAYLAWLGLKLLAKPRSAFEALDASGREPQAARSAFWRGLLTNLLNPKIGVFYLTFLPQFVPAGPASPAYPFFLAVIHVLLTLVWFAVLIAATLPLAGLLRRPAAMRLLDRVTGAVFLGFGLRLATSRMH